MIFTSQQALESRPKRTSDGPGRLIGTRSYLPAFQPHRSAIFESASSDAVQSYSCSIAPTTASPLPTLAMLSTFAFAKDKFQQPGPIHLNRDGEKWAEKTLRKMSSEEKVGQLFMIWVRAEFLNVSSPEYLELRDTMQKYHIGSFAMTVRWEPPFLYRNQPYEAAELLNRLQKDSKLPLLFAADFERGITMRLHGGTTFPHAMAFGAAGKTEYAEAFGRITGEEARAVGIHWNFFPDADVNSNPANPIINTRSFGEDPKQVGELVAAYIRGAHQSGMMTTVKHFPGHGDTATDSHLSVAQVTGDRSRLQSVELPPFQSGISAGVDSVMVAHVTVPALDPFASDRCRSAEIVHPLPARAAIARWGLSGVDFAGGPLPADPP